MLNIVLGALILVAYLANLYILKRNSRSIIYQDNDLSNLNRVLLRLSLSFNNQVVEIKNINVNIKLYLVKYQFDKYWGIKIITPDKEGGFLKIKTYLTETNYAFNHHFNNEGIEQIEILGQSNLDELLKLIQGLLKRFYSDSSGLFKYLFTKKSIITL